MAITDKNLRDMIEAKNTTWTNRVVAELAEELLRHRAMADLEIRRIRKAEIGALSRSLGVGVSYDFRLGVFSTDNMEKATLAALNVLAEARKEEMDL